MSSAPGHKPVPRKNLKTPTKRSLWLKHFLDEGNPATFLSQPGSAKAAGYRCKSEPSFASLGCENYKYHRDMINEWLEEYGFSENRLKLKMMELMSVTEEKFFSAPQKDEKGFVTGMHIESRTVPAIETQRRTLDMAAKVKGLYKPVIHEVAGKKGGKIEINHSLDESWKELLTAVTTDNDLGLPNAAVSEKDE